MDDFEQFDAFQRCREFVRAVAEPLNRGAFSKDPVLVTQLRKTMLSIYSNFAEGFERDGNREFTQFVSIAKGSVGETRGQLLYALDSGYLDQERFEQLNELGEIRHTLTSRGTPIGNMDLLIAAHARALSATLVTNNIADFSRVPGLTCENWAT